MKTRKASFLFCSYLPLALLVGLLAFPVHGFAFSGDDALGNSSSADISIYDGSLADADVYIEIPALRQYGGYTCGATCVQMLMNWLEPYAADLNLTRYEELLGTTPEKGTPPDSIVGYLAESDVAFAAFEHWSLEDLRAALDAGHPVMMALQAWSSADDGSYNVDDPTNADTYLVEGHWVICVGYCDDPAKPYFIFNDPACVGHTLLYADELAERWVDMDGDGVIYDHFGIEISQSVKFDADGLFHMD